MIEIQFYICLTQSLFKKTLTFSVNSAAQHRTLLKQWVTASGVYSAYNERSTLTGHVTGSKLTFSPWAACLPCSWVGQRWPIRVLVFLWVHTAAWNSPSPILWIHFNLLKRIVILLGWPWLGTMPSLSNPLTQQDTQPKCFRNNTHAWQTGTLNWSAMLLMKRE